MTLQRGIPPKEAVRLSGTQCLKHTVQMSKAAALKPVKLLQTTVQLYPACTLERYLPTLAAQVASATFSVPTFSPQNAH
jgi:hypothetical protein